MHNGQIWRVFVCLFLKVLSLLKENPCMRTLLEMPGEASDVSADDVAGLLKTNHSVLGSNRRPKEEVEWW